MDNKERERSFETAAPDLRSLVRNLSNWSPAGEREREREREKDISQLLLIASCVDTVAEILTFCSSSNPLRTNVALR